jgi:hypothetical protein
VLATPLEHRLGDAVSRHGRGVEAHHPPVRRENGQAIPAHLAPTVGGEYVGHVERIVRVPTHPASEGLMVMQQRGVIAASRQALGLRLRGEIQQADRQSVKLYSRRRSYDFTLRDGIAGQQ